jgi:hypothetical protein
MLAGPREDTQSARHFDAFAARREDTFALIHQKQVSLKLKCQGDGIPFAFVKILHRTVINFERLANLDPSWRPIDPTSDWRRPGYQFVANT